MKLKHFILDNSTRIFLLLLLAGTTASKDDDLLPDPNPETMSLQKIFRPSLLHYNELEESQSKFINVGMIIIKNPFSDEDDIYKFESELKRNLLSILKNSRGSPIRLLVITNAYSIMKVNKDLKNIYTKHIVENFIRTYVGQRFLPRVPKLQLDYVDLESITETARGIIKELKNCTISSGLGKYGADLFYIAPAYPIVFSKLGKILMLDHDLEFFIPIEEVWKIFSDFPSSAIIGVGPDLQPHYHSITQLYRQENPDSEVGMPGKLQGFNTGLVLYDLEAMRKSELWNRYTTPGNLCPLIKKFKFVPTLGDQDYFTAMGFESPELFHILPCQYNAQTSVQLDREPFSEIFHSFHHCEPPHNIVHRNGCGPTREDCERELYEYNVKLYLKRLKEDKGVSPANQYTNFATWNRKRDAFCRN